jgi:hypothetical protein
MAEGYKLWPYFGGNETAPHDIYIWMKWLFNYWIIVGLLNCWIVGLFHCFIVELFSVIANI